MAKRGKTARNKGNNAEREYVQLFKAIGFENCSTSRYSSRKLDACDVDIVDLPFNVQVKAGYKGGLNYSNVIKKVKDQILEYYPDDIELREKPTICIHKKDVGAGNKRQDIHEIVSMTLEDFIKIIKKVDKWD